MGQNAMGKRSRWDSVFSLRVFARLCTSLERLNLPGQSLPEGHTR